MASAAALRAVPPRILSSGGRIRTSDLRVMSPSLGQHVGADRVEVLLNFGS
jgi:hypothetical protein